MARVTMRAALFAALLSVALLPGLDAATKKRVPTPRPVTVSSGDLVFTTASPPTITARSSKGATRGSVRLGATAKIGSALLTAVSPSGKLAAVLSVGASDGATYVTLVQLKPTLKLIGSAAVPGFGTFANPPAAPYWEAGGFLLAVGDFSKRGLATLFIDAVAPDTNCSGVWANTATFDRSRLKISKFQSKTQIASFGTTCPVFNPPLPTLVRSSGLIGSSLSSLYIIQNLNSEDILVQNIIRRPDRSGKLTAVFSAMSSSIGNCFMYVVGDSKNFYGACEVDSKLSVQLARFTKGKAPVKITKGNLEAGGGNFRFMATSPKNPNLWAAISRPNKRGKAQPDLIAPIRKSNGKLGRTFNVPGGYAHLNVVP